MKIVKIILATLAGIILLFLSIGLLFPSYEYQSSIVVNASPEKCWTVYHDTKKMSEWLEGFESLTLKSGEQLTLGSTYEIVITDDGHRMVMNEKIIEVNAPTKVTYELNNDALKSEFSFSFEGINSTTVTTKYKITGNNVLWRSILLLSKSYMSTEAKKQLEGLKNVIEKQ